VVSWGIFRNKSVGEERRGIGFVIVRHYRRDAFLRVFGLRVGRFGIVWESDQSISYLPPHTCQQGII
jgi:hypothetical protein